MTISFPHLGDYSVPIQSMLKRLFPKAKILVAPPITKRTLELGAAASPDFVCSPFKYNLGNFIEALQLGADVLVQAGGGCRFGFYGELQEQILRDMGYKFAFINIFGGTFTPLGLIKQARKLGSRRGLLGLALTVLLAAKSVKAMDMLDMHMRENVGFEVTDGDFQRLKAEFLRKLGEVRTFKELRKLKKEYLIKYKAVPVNKPENALRVGIVGELYNLMEPFANYFMEKELAKNGIAVTRFTNATYLLFQKDKHEKKTLARAGRYLKYHIGADGTDTVANAAYLAGQGYDGVIHIKPFGCTPEVNAMPMLININKDYGIPILYFSFDSQTSEAGIKTRLEAFYDMLSMRQAKRCASALAFARNDNTTKEIDNTRGGREVKAL